MTQPNHASSVSFVLLIQGYLFLCFGHSVIEMKVGQVDSGAFISELSQYPFEKVSRNE